MEYGLIGEKLGHSYSKIIHEQLLKHYVYEIHPLSREELKTFMEAKAFKAINVTIPYKTEVIPYLDYIDEAASKINAVNTIINQDGYLIGKNTDYAGFAYLLDKHNIQIKNQKILIMGNGGASKACQAVVKDKGCKEMILVDLILQEGVITLAEVYEHHQDVDIIINTTPLGMFPHVERTPLDITYFKQCTACVDIIYNPLQTKLIRQAKQRQITGIGGLEMLVAQAKFALEHFKNIQIDDQEIDRIYHHILLQTSNLSLIGMPSCGKTTIAKILTTMCDKEYIDIDEQIVAKIGMSIPEYFDRYSEEQFRKIETEVCAEVAKLNNKIISCGGGIIKNADNIDLLKQNGFIVYIKRDIDLLISDNSRPLSSSKEAIMRLYEERKEAYERYHDFCVNNDTDITTVCQTIMIAYQEALTNFNKEEK